jgi:outer membrane protein assembly factor BamB
MARLLDMFDVWRSWSVRRRLAVAPAAGAGVAGVAIAVYLATKRPGDVSNPDAAFHKRTAAIKTVDWPLYGHDLERTRYLPGKNLNPPFRSSEWSFQAGKLLEFQPIVVRDRIYFMDKDGLFYALNADTGKVEWKRKIGSLNASSPAYSDGRLFAVSLEPNQAVALEPREHGSKVLWRQPLPGRSESSPLVYHGRVIFGCESGDIFALDEKTGKTRWTVSTAGPVKGGLAFHDGTVFAGNYAGEIHAIDASNGKVEWTAHTQGGGLLRGGGVYSTPAVAWGRVYLGSLDGRIYSYVEKTGELAWSHSTGAEVYPSPAVADTPHSPPTVYAGSQDKHFYALDARTGELRWEHPLDGVVLGSSSVVGETVYVAMIGPNTGTIGYRVKDGKKVWENDQGEYNPVISDGEKIYLTGYSTIRAFKPDPNPHGRGKHRGGGKDGGGN